MYTRNRQLGKFEGSGSQLLAEVLYNATGISAHESEFGDCYYLGWHGLIVGKRYAFIVSEDNYGFFTVDAIGPISTMREKFAKMEESYLEEYSDNDYC